MDLINALYSLASALVVLFVLGFISKILVWWYSGSFPMAKVRGASK